MAKELIVVGNQGGCARSSGSSVWIRLSAFLSLKSPNTQSTYVGILREWCQFLGAEFGTDDGARVICQATDLHAIAYRNWLEKRPGEKPRAARKESTSPGVVIHRPGKKQKKSGIESTQSNATIAKKFAALRRVYRMFIASDVGAVMNPFDTDRVPPPPRESGRKRPTEMVDFSLVKTIISQPDPATPKGLRDQAILALLFGGGLRRSEVCALRVGDVRKTPNGTLFVYLRATKAKKDAQQALPGWAAAIVSKLAVSRREQGAQDGDFLCIAYLGQGGKAPAPEPVSASGVYKLFKLYCSLAGAGKFVTPHSARATAITRLLAEGVPHRQVQEFSRHSSIQMVELYDKRRISVDENPAKVLDYE